jgi:hypothetical protein
VRQLTMGSRSLARPRRCMARRSGPLMRRNREAWGVTPQLKYACWRRSRVFLSHLPIDIAVVIWRHHGGSETIAIAPRVGTQCYPVRRSRGPEVSNPSLQTGAPPRRHRLRWSCSASRSGLMGTKRPPAIPRPVYHRGSAVLKRPRRRLPPTARSIPPTGCPRGFV